MFPSTDGPRRAQRRLRGLAVSVLAWTALGACEAGVRDSRGTSASPQGLFADLDPTAGLDFVHINGMAGDNTLAEIMGAGAAFVDYDNDGDLDIYLVQGHLLGEGGAGIEPPGLARGPSDRLFRNELLDGSGEPGTLRFTDVTEEAGLFSATGYGMGVAAGDFDGDGFVDLYVTNLGSNQLWRNRGDGTFEDVTRAAGADDPRWSTSAAFLDYDADGHLDLFVANYVIYSLASDLECFLPSGIPSYCGPMAYRPAPDRLLHNRGDGTFEEVTARAGIAGRYGNGLGVVSLDADGDGRLDLYVANDQVHNQLWVNQGDGTFVDLALETGCAVNLRGQPEASMGVDAADVDQDGDEDLFLSHLAGETHTLFANLADAGSGLFFEDRTLGSGLQGVSVEATGFGTAFLDFDNDGALDLAVVNGEVGVDEAQLRAGEPYPLKQPNQLFRNAGGGELREVTDQAPGWMRREVSRGLAVGDVDNDGDADLLETNSSGPARLHLNLRGQDRAWIGLWLVGGSPARDRLGARATVVPVGGEPRSRRVRTDGSYLCSRDPRLLFGLGDLQQVERVIVDWPGGAREEWTGVATGGYRTLVQGTGRPLSAP